MLRRSFILTAVIALVYLYSSTALARQDLIPGARYTAAAGAAMGDAYIALGSDIPAGIFYNPAILGKVRDFQVEPLNISGYLNLPFFEAASTKFYEAFDLRAYAPTLQRHPGQNSGLGGQAIFSAGFSFINFALLGVSEFAGKADGNGNVTYRSLYQMIPAVGTGFRLFDGVVRVGYSLQWVNQASGTRTVPVSDSISYQNGLAQGSGFSHNFGLAVTAPIRMLPTLNFVIRNALGTHFTRAVLVGFANTVSGVPETEPMTVDASFSVQPRLGAGTLLNLVLEGRDLTNRSGVGFAEHFSLGAELNYRKKFFLRGGIRGGYPSAGIGLSRIGAEMSLSVYTEEIGTLAARSGDTRFVLQYQLRNF